MVTFTEEVSLKVVQPPESLKSNLVTNYVSETEMIRTKMDRMMGTRLTRHRDVVITEHALIRWNERVYPYIESIEELGTLMYFILNSPVRRYRTIQKDISNDGKYKILIDEDIVAILVDEGDVTKVISFHGRLSLVPILKERLLLQKKQRIKGKVQNKGFKHGQEAEDIILFVPKRVLEKVPPMALPNKITVFQLETSSYIIEKFFNKEDGKELSVVTLRDKGGILDSWVIHIDKEYEDVRFSHFLVEYLREEGYNVRCPGNLQNIGTYINEV